MVIWYPCTEKEFVTIQEEFYSGGNSIVLLSRDHLGDEEEPMDLFVWGDSVTRVPMLRSTTTVNKQLYWRT